MKITYNIQSLFVLLLLGFSLNMAGQEKVNASYSLSLRDAVNMAKQQNKTVQILKTEEKATLSDYKDLKNAVLPTITAAGSYQRYSNLTLYENGLSESVSVEKRPGPNAANLGIDVSFNLYSGGRQRSIIEESKYKNELAEINSNDQSGNVGLQAAIQYLDLIRLYHFNKLILDQQKRAETRLKNITSFYNNQKVTKSDLLRAKLTLSNVLLTKTQNDNDIVISRQKLNVLLNIPQDAVINPVDTTLTQNLGQISIEEIKGSKNNAYILQKADANLKIQSARIKNINANYYPSLSLVSAYGYNYPNNLFFPPVDQIYAIGYVGFRFSYNISSVYQNKHKSAAAKERLSEFTQQKEWLEDNVNQEVSSLNIKFNEAQNRIQVTDESIEQAKVNLNIINTKYLNQLALLTDLLDADNLYQETTYSHVNAQISALAIYYRLMYTTGNL